MLPRPTCIYAPGGGRFSRLSQLLTPAPVTALVGGGGKTSTMLALAQELAEAGHPVTVTTTTHIRPVPKPWPDGLTVEGVPTGEGKLGPAPRPDSLAEQGRFLLIEADGSRGLPAKAPEAWEPALTEGTQLVIAVLGLTALERPISEVCHRPERVAELLGVSQTHRLTPEDCAALILSPQGLRKGVGSRAFAIVLNQADTPALRLAGACIAGLLPSELPCALTSYR